MPPIVHRLLDSTPDGPPLAPAIGAAISLVLGLIFVFVWAPHPWGWYGIDQYHDLARALARGEPFGTTDVPWGYAYFVAAFYAAFGERGWIPVTAQVLANATIPLMLFRLVRALGSDRVAAIASLVVGVFSFNTVYASTQSSDSICTVLFVASLLCFVRGHQTGAWGHIAASGLLAGVVPQFRPNMILFPLVAAAAYVAFTRRRLQAVARMTLFLALVCAALAPWVVRNYRLTGAFLPTSTHGGVQLWYGTLQVGPYLESRAYNPRSIFEAAPFDYTTMTGQPLVVTAVRPRCGPSDDTAVELIYRTDRDPRPARVSPEVIDEDDVIFRVPGQPAPTTVYYHFEMKWTDPSTGQPVRASTPVAGDRAPRVFFVTTEHLTDLDRHGDLLDVFDLIGLIRRVAWQEPSGGTALDLDGSGAIDQADVELAAVRLLGDGARLETAFAATPLEATDERATLHLADASTFTVPRRFSGVLTDLDVRGVRAGSLVAAQRPMQPDLPVPRTLTICQQLWNVQVNEVFYRKEPHLMRRYTALALDNIARDPWAFAAASVYRIGRLFLVRGTDDARTTQQFEGSRLVYVGGLALSALYLMPFLAGVVLAARARSPLVVFLIPIAYVPLTICFVLTNMRYTITVQPLMFIFAAVAIASVFPAPGTERRREPPATAGGTTT